MTTFPENTDSRPTWFDWQVQGLLEFLFKNGIGTDPGHPGTYTYVGRVVIGDKVIFAGARTTTDGDPVVK